jgi:hypothetical protein
MQRPPAWLADDVADVEDVNQVSQSHSLRVSQEEKPTSSLTVESRSRRTVPL